MYLRIWIAQLTLSALTKRTAPSLWFLSPRGTSDSARLCTSENGNRQASLGRGRNTPPPPNLHSQFPSAESLAQVPYYLSCTEEGKYFQQLFRADWTLGILYKKCILYNNRISSPLDFSFSKEIRLWLLYWSVIQISYKSIY